MRPHDTAHPQRSFGREEIAVFPAGLDANPFFRSVADRASDGAQFGALQFDIHRHDTRLVACRGGYFARSNRNRGDEARRRNRAPQVEGKAALIGIARFEAGDFGQMPARQEVRLAADNFAENIFAFRRDVQCQVAFDPLVIDQQFRRVNGGERITGLAKRAIQIELLLHNGVALQVVARINLEGIPQFRTIGSR